MLRLTLLRTLEAARGYVVDVTEEAERQVALYDGYPTLDPKHRTALTDARTTLAAVDAAIADLADHAQEPASESRESSRAP